MKYTLSLLLLLPVFFFAPASTAAQLLSVEAAACGMVSFSPAQLLRYHSGDELQIVQTTRAGAYLTTIELVDTQGKPIRSIGGKDGVFRILNSTLPETGFLIYRDNCANVRRIHDLAKTNESSEWITMSRPFHDFVKKEFNREGKISHSALFEAVLMSDFPEVEKKAFIQSHFMHGKPVFADSDFFDKDFVFQAFSEEKSLLDCKCSGLEVPAEYVLSPGDIRNAEGPNGFYEMTSNTGDPNPVHEPNLGDRELEFFKGGVGPAKTWFAYSDGWKRPGGDFWGGSVGNNGVGVGVDTAALSTDLGNRIAQVFTIACSGGVSSEIRNCSCEKEIGINWFYESIVDVRAQKLRSGNGNRAVAIGEDVAVAWATQEQAPDEDPELFLAGTLRNRRATTCGSDPNDSWVGDAALLAGTIAATAASFLTVRDSASGPQTAAQSQLQLLLLNQVFTQAGNLLNGDDEDEDVLEVDVPCGTPSAGDVVPMTVEPRVFFLKPGRSLYVGIMSGSRMVSMGTRSWQSEVIIKSDFYLASYLPGGRESSADTEDCCSPERRGYYWSYGFDPDLVIHDYEPQNFNFIPPSDDIELRSKVARWYMIEGRGIDWNFPTNGRGDFFVPFDYARVIHRSKFDPEFCVLSTTGDDEESPFPDVEIGGRRSGNFTGNSNPAAPGTLLQIELIDLSGRLVGNTRLSLDNTGSYDSGKVFRFFPDFAPTIAQSLTNRLPAGMYVAIARNPQTKAFVGQVKIIIK